MSLRDDAFDIYERLGDFPFAAYYPRQPVVAGGITVVCDLPVEWVATPVPVPPVTPGDGSAPFVTRVPRPLADKVRKKTCVEVPPVYAHARVRAVAHVGSTVEVAALHAAHTLRIVDPLPGILVEDEELLVMLAAME